MECKEIFNYSEDNYSKYCNSDNKKSKRKIFIGVILLLNSILFFYLQFNNYFDNVSNNYNTLLTILNIIIFFEGFGSFFLMVGGLYDIMFSSFSDNIFIKLTTYVLDDANNLYKIIIKNIGNNNTNSYNKWRGFDIVLKRLTGKKMMLGHTIDVANYLEAVSEENKKLKDMEELNFILNDPKASEGRVQVIKILNVYSITDYEDRLEIICDALYMERDKLVEKDKIAIYKCYNNIDELIKNVKQRVNDEKVDLEEEKKLVEWAVSSNNLVYNFTNKINRSITMSIFSAAIASIIGSVWVAFILGNVFLISSYKTCRKIKLSNEYEYKKTMIINLVLSTLYFILLLVDIIM